MKKFLLIYGLSLFLMACANQNPFSHLQLAIDPIGHKCPSLDSDKDSEWSCLIIQPEVKDDLIHYMVVRGLFGNDINKTLGLDQDYQTFSLPPKLTTVNVEWLGVRPGWGWLKKNFTIGPLNIQPRQIYVLTQNKDGANIEVEVHNFDTGKLVYKKSHAHNPMLKLKVVTFKNKN